MKRLRSILPRLGALCLAVALLTVGATTSRGDTFVLKDGTSLDGRVVKEDDGFVWLKTLAKVEKIAKARVESREAGESSVDRYEALKKAADKDAKSADAQWALCEFCLAHSAEGDLAKQAKKLLRKTLKLDPDHAAARAANGDVKFKSEWVKKGELERLEAEEANRQLRLKWGKILGVKVEVYGSDRFLLVDNTDEKDLAGRAQALDEAYALLKEVLDVEDFWTGQCVIVTVEDYKVYLDAINEFNQSSWHMSEGYMAAARHEMTGGVWREKPDPIQVRWPSSGHEGMWSAVVHNVAHIAIWKLWRRPPVATWLEEGLGMWVELEVTDDNVASCVGASDSSKKGSTKAKRKGKKHKRKGGAALRESQSEWKERCIDAIESDEFPAMRKFLGMQMGEYGAAEEGAAQGFVTWLLGKDREKFAELERRVRARPKNADLPWKDTYGYELIEDMDKEWRTWALTDW